MPGGGNPFFAISETNQPLCLARVENTDLLSIGREYRLTVFIRRVEDTGASSDCIASWLSFFYYGSSTRNITKHKETSHNLLKTGGNSGIIYILALPSDEIEGIINQDDNILAEKKHEIEVLFSQWKSAVKDILLGIETDTNPKELIRTIAAKLLETYESARLLDNYDVYDCLLNYWNAKLQDDVYAIKAGGYAVGREIDYEYAKKKQKDESGETVEVDDTSKVKSFEGALIPKEIIEAVYFAEELAELTALMEKSGALEAELDEMTQLCALFEEGKTDEMEALIREMPEVAEFDIRNKNGTFGKAKLKAALKQASETAVVPEIYADEYAALTAYAAKSAEKDAVNKEWKAARKALDEKVLAKYGELADEEVKHLLFDLKWMYKLESDVRDEVEQVMNTLCSRVLLIAKRYERTLGEIEEKTAKSRTAVMAALECH